MQNSEFENFEEQNNHGYLADEFPSLDEDVVMEEILKNLNSTPIGQVLKKIAMLPEVRKEKVLGVRQQLTAGEYEVNNRLEAALDKVLEDLVA